MIITSLRTHQQQQDQHIFMEWEVAVMLVELDSPSGGGIGQMVTESFDLDIMMPPDIASI